VHTCANCGRPIGNLETPYLHAGYVVCLGCKQRLSTEHPGAIPQSTLYPPPQQEREPLDDLAAAAAHRPTAPYRSSAPAGRSPARRAWKNVSLLGLAMFAVGAVLEFTGAPACGYFGLAGLVIWLVAGVVAFSLK
jgi:hypothetical protein